MDDKEPNSRTSQEIDENLRRVFKEMEGSNLPDRFTDLLQQLRNSDGNSGGAS
ncbi:NepR family anti-sigma factor [Jannaschia sp.]|nr:NepR family anti-sigma factor [Jannaschia sp.]